MRKAHAVPQQVRAIALIKTKGMVRLNELVEEGVAASTVSRMERAGTITRLARGLYQLTDAPIDEHHTLAEVAKLVPKGVICLTSALAFHDLTDELPAKVWVAIGPKDWRPTFDYPPARFVRFSGARLTTGATQHRIDGTDVPVFDVAKTIADLFRYRRTIGVNVAVEGLREALRTRKATPAQISEQAEQAGVWTVMEPYVMALTSHV